MVPDDWLARLAVILEFLSFWLAAPEILGEDRLRRAEVTLEKFLSRLRRLSEILGDRLNEWPYSFFNWTTFITVVGGLVVSFLFTFCLTIVFSAVGLDADDGLVSFAIFLPIFIYIAVMLSILAYFVITPFLLLPTRAFTYVLIRLLRNMADDTKLRQRSLILGAVLFIASTILELLLI